jgi:hypothetical protein
MSRYSFPITEPLPHRRRPSRNYPLFGVFRFREKARKGTRGKAQRASVLAAGVFARRGHGCLERRRIPEIWVFLRERFHFFGNPELDADVSMATSKKIGRLALVFFGTVLAFYNARLQGKRRRGRPKRQGGWS